jgi:catechol 2,3-dioxygenase-like lactoylglutathione lyase family enzyme
MASLPVDPSGPPVHPAGPIVDLAGLTLEVNHLDRALVFYQTLFGLDLIKRDDQRGLAALKVNDHQTLSLWEPATRTPMLPGLEALNVRGAAHLHYAWQILQGDIEGCKSALDAHGIAWQQINLGTPEQPDVGLYFFDPFGHGLELRTVDLNDARSTAYPPAPQRSSLHVEGGSAAPNFTLPVVGLREVALAFGDYPAMLERLPRAYGFAFAKEQEDRAFAQFTLGPEAQEDGNGTPARWLYAWDPQVGLADMLGGDHVLAEFYADVPAVLKLVQKEQLHYLQDGQALAVRDPEGHVFIFRPRLDLTGPDQPGAEAPDSE